MKPDSLRIRFDRVSGLPEEKKAELFHTAELFQEPPLTVDDLLDALGELIDEDEFFEDENEDDGE